MDKAEHGFENEAEERLLLDTASRIYAYRIATGDHELESTPAHQAMEAAAIFVAVWRKGRPRWDHAAGDSR